MSSNKSIGILNFQYSDHNYGAVLQAAALEYTIRSLGYEDVEHINFIPQRKTSLKGHVGNLLRRLGLRRTVRPRIANSEAFERFRKQHLQRSREVRSHSDFVDLANSYSAIVVGSDQVWRPSMAHNANVYFLKGVASPVKRIGYAASFGVDTWEPGTDEPVTQTALKELKKFHGVSTREDSGVDLCKTTFGVDAEHVLDPLLLVDHSFFDDVAPRAKQDYAKFVYYKLDADEQFFADIHQLEKHYGTQARNLYQKQGSSEPAFEEVDVWLASIREADVVLTDSFHCACVALRFNKEVLFILNQNRGKARFDSLFKMFDIEIKPLTEGLPSTIYTLSAPNFGSRYDASKAKSIAFLQRYLG